MDNKVKLINELIVKSVLHGGDAGGPYMNDEEEVFDTMKRMKEEFEFLKEYDIMSVKVDDDFYVIADDMPQFVKVI